MHRLVLRSLVLSSVVLGVSFPAAPVNAGPPIDLPELDIAYEYDPPLAGHGYWVGDSRGGEWRVVGGGLGDDDRMTLEVEVRPPAVSVPLEPGPAILFGTLGLYGSAGGDVGAGASVDRLVTRVLPACADPTDCVYRGSITLPTHRLPGMARRHRAESWREAFVGLTLVRTFAQGTWLQVLPLYDETRQEPDGTVAHPLPISSEMLALGAFPVGDREQWGRRERPMLDRIEELRQSVDDPSTLPETQPLLIDIETASCTPGWTIATTTGDALVNADRGGRSVPIRVDAPVGAEWEVSVPSLDRAHPSANPARTFGPFRSDVPGSVSGWVSGDPYLCGDNVEPGLVSWRPATADEVSSFEEADPADALDTYSTLPARDHAMADEQEQAAAALTAAVLGDERMPSVHERVLGLYLDDATGEHVVVVPSTGDVPSAADYAAFGLPVRIETLDLTPEELEAIRSDARSLAASLSREGRGAFGIWFDARLGRVVVEDSAPASAFATLLERYPGKVEYRQGEPGSRQAGEVAVTADPCATTGLEAATQHGTIERLVGSSGPLSASDVVEWRNARAAASDGRRNDARSIAPLTAPTETSYFICTYRGSGFVAPTMTDAESYDGIRLIVPLESHPILEAILTGTGRPRPTEAGSRFEHLWQPLDPADVPFGYVCEPGLPFTTADLAAAQALDEVPESLAEAVKHWAERIAPGADEWTVVRQADGQVLALTPGHHGGLESMKLESRMGDAIAGFAPGIAWDFATGGDCRAQATFVAGRWRLDPRFPTPGPKTRTLHVLGYLGCNGSERAGPARIHTTDDAVLIAIPMRSVVHSDACSGFGPQRMTIRLREPLGDRTLYDAGELPLRGATERLAIDRVDTSSSGG